MGDCITLDDGRSLCRSSMAISGVLYFAAKYLPEGHEPLRRWLNDVKDRPNGFASVDLRGLTPEDRAAFHVGARRAYDETIGRGVEIGPTSVSLAALDVFIQMQDSIRRGEPPESLNDSRFHDREIFAEDLTNLWTS